jgi:hypothetical protein
MHIVFYVQNNAHGLFKYMIILSYTYDIGSYARSIPINTLLIWEEKCKPFKLKCSHLKHYLVV